MTTFEKIVKGATKVKVAPPKTKYVEPILMATNQDSPMSRDNLNVIMRTLSVRLQDSSWSVVYKSLIVLHIMIREGVKDVTLEYLSNYGANMLSLSSSSMSKASSYSNDVRFVVKYSKYLQARVKEFTSTGIDYVRDERSSNSNASSGGRLRTLTVEKGLLRETSSVQKQIDALLKNNFMENDINNDIILTAFRLLVNDLLALFQELNEGVINILEHYFEMSKIDAETALKIYKKFVDQTKFVIDYLRVAKHLEYATKLHVPTIKHAPTALTSSLEEYLDDPNFEINRKQYLAEKSQKNIKADVKSSEHKSSLTETNKSSNHDMNKNFNLEPTQLNTGQNENGRVASLIVQQSTYNPWGNVLNQYQVQQPQQQQLQQQQLQQQQLQQQQLQQQQLQQQQLQQQQLQQQQLQQQQLQQQQLQQQQLQQQQLQQQHTQQQQQQESYQASQAQAPLNSTFTGAGFGGYGVQAQGTGNPFMQNTGMVGSSQPSLARSVSNPFMSMTQQQSSLQPQLTQTATGSTNPFANSRFSPNSGTTSLTFGQQQQQTQPSSTSIATNNTGNPFKVSQSTTKLFNSVSDVQQPLKSQPTAGGLENIPTFPVFPETQAAAKQQTLLNGARAQLQQQQTSQQIQQLQAQATFQSQPQQLQYQQMQPQSQQFQSAPQFSQSFQQATGQQGMQSLPAMFDYQQQQANPNQFTNVPFAQTQHQQAQYQEPPSLI